MLNITVLTQNRERLFIVGIRKDIDQTFEFPQPLSYIPCVNEVMKERVKIIQIFY